MVSDLFHMALLYRLAQLFSVNRFLPSCSYLETLRELAIICLNEPQKLKIKDFHWIIRLITEVQCPFDVELEKKIVEKVLKNEKLINASLKIDPTSFINFVGLLIRNGVSVPQSTVNSVLGSDYIAHGRFKDSHVQTGTRIRTTTGSINRKTRNTLKPLKCISFSRLQYFGFSTKYR